MSGFTLSSIANMFILMTLYDFSLLHVQFCYITVYTVYGMYSLSSFRWSSIYSLGSDCTENAISKYSSIVIYSFVA
jgi:hypothetical protein